MRPPLTIDAMIARGRAAFEAYVRGIYPVTDRPVGADHLAVVTSQDFIAEPALCLRYVAADRPLYVLEDGAVYALLCRHHMPS